MILLVIMVVALLAFAGVGVVSTRDHRVRKGALAQAKLDDIEALARDHYELSPQFAQIVLDEIRSYHRKELS